MILTGKKIQSEISKKKIEINPFNKQNIQPNGYDFHLGNTLLIYEDGIIDTISNNHKKVIIPSNGIILEPNKLYLGITLESFKTDTYAQLLFGDRSIGSMGVWVHISAPLAHVGSAIRWTLEIRVVKKTIIYPFMKFGKVCFLVNYGAIKNYGDSYFSQSGKYLSNEISPSLFYHDNLI